MSFDGIRITRSKKFLEEVKAALLIGDENPVASRSDGARCCETSDACLSGLSMRMLSFLRQSSDATTFCFITFGHI